MFSSHVLLLLSNGAGQDSFRVDTPLPHDFEHGVHGVYVITGSITKRSIIKRVAQGSHFVFEGSFWEILGLEGLSSDLRDKDRVEYWKKHPL